MNKCKPISKRVVCDLCGEEYTYRKDTGGILFNSNAVCPECLPEFEKLIDKYDEGKFIRAKATKNETFYDFVLRIRSGIHLN